MKILIINKSAVGGGAAVAANRLLVALNSVNADAKMLVQDQPPYSMNNVSYLTNSKIDNLYKKGRFIAERLYFLPYEKNKSIRYLFSPAFSGIDISKHPLVQEADIIHLHWINFGFLSVRSLKKLFALNKPIVWTLHDMWAFTGGCHYSGDCTNYKDKCGDCHEFVAKANKNDLSAKVHKRKVKIYANANINAVGCSNWLANTALDSSLLKNKNVCAIPNPIDIDVFKPRDKDVVRKEFDLPVNKKLLLFGAANIADPRKGTIYLLEALKILRKNHPELYNEVELIVFGRTDKADIDDMPFVTHNKDYMKDAVQIAKLYSCADVFVLPSLQDNLPNTVMEAASCGVPTAAFNIGGIPDMVVPDVTGFLATSKNSEELADCIYKLVASPKLETYQENARQYVLDNFTNEKVANRYLDFYKSLL